MLRYNPESLVGRPKLDLIHPNDAPAVVSSASQLVSADAVSGAPRPPTTFRVRHPDGRRRSLEALAPLLPADAADMRSFRHPASLGCETGANACYLDRPSLDALQHRRIAL